MRQKETLSYKHIVLSTYLAFEQLLLPMGGHHLHPYRTG